MNQIKSLKTEITKLTIPEDKKETIATHLLALELMEDITSSETLRSIDELRAALNSLQSDKKYDALEILNDFSEEVDLIIIERMGEKSSQKKKAA